MKKIFIISFAVFISSCSNKTFYEKNSYTIESIKEQIKNGELENISHFFEQSINCCKDELINDDETMQVYSDYVSVLLDSIKNIDQYENEINFDKKKKYYEMFLRSRLQNDYSIEPLDSLYNLNGYND